MSPNRYRRSFTGMLLASAFALTLNGLWGLAQVGERVDANYTTSLIRSHRTVAAKAKLPAPSTPGPAIVPVRVNLPAPVSLRIPRGGGGVRSVAVLSLGGPSDRAPPA